MSDIGEEAFVESGQVVYDQSLAPSLQHTMQCVLQGCNFADLHAHPQDISLRYRQGHRAGQHQATLNNAGINVDGCKYCVDEAVKKVECVVYGHKSPTHASGCSG